MLPVVECVHPSLDPLEFFSELVFCDSGLVHRLAYPLYP